MKLAISNLKGGVGKSTLSLLLSNYLSNIGYRVFLADMDRQATSYNEREKDLSTFDNEVPYIIKSYDVDNVNEINELMDMDIEENDFIIIDTPGTINEDSLYYVFSKADYILCPYQYESKCLDSTGTFIQVINKIIEMSKSDVKFLFVPNKVDKRIGKREEKELWQETDKIFEQFGIVIPPINYNAAIQRCNTIGLTKDQRDLIEPAFSSVIKNIFNN